MSEYLKINWNAVNEVLVPTKDTLDRLLSAINLEDLEGVLDILHGGTGADNATQARINLGAAAEEHTHSASDITTGGTIEGDIIVNGSFTSNAILPSDKTKTQIPLIYVPQISAKDLGVAETDTLPVYITAWLKWICQNYSYRTGSIYIGSMYPSNKTLVWCYIYDTDNVDPDTGLPEYCNGIKTTQNASGLLYTFEVLNYKLFTYNLGQLSYSVGVLPLNKGGTNATNISSARSNLQVPGQMGIQPDMNLPFGYGLLSNRGSLGNTINSVPSTDNYYYGVDDTATLWGGVQVNGTTFPTLYPAMMMNNGSQRYKQLYSGSISTGNSIVLDDGYKYSMLLIGTRKDNTNTSISCIPATSIYMIIDELPSYSLVIETTVNDPSITLTIRNTSSPDTIINFIWGVLRHTK